VKKLLDNTGLTELTKDVVKVITIANHKKKITIGLRVVTYIGNITVSVVLLSVRRNAMYMIGLITNRQSICLKRDSKHILSSGSILRIDLM
jgi:hypothetical protein